MIITIFTIAAILAYLTVAAWVLGYVCAKWAAQARVKYPNLYDRGKLPDYGDPIAYIVALTWPVYITCSFIIPTIFSRVARSGEKFATKTERHRQIRIEVEKKIRVEQDKIQQEAEQEVEKLLRQNAA